LWSCSTISSVQPDERLERVRLLREQGRTPKQVARALGISPAEAGRLVRAVAAAAQAAAPEPPLVGCWISPGWSTGLTVGDHPGWPLREDPGGGTEGLIAVLVARGLRYGRVSVCGYLVDAYCLGVKNALGPELMDDRELRRFIRQYFSGYRGDPVEAPIELARELVFGSVEYARGLVSTRTPTSPPPRGISARGQARVPSGSARTASRFTSSGPTTIRDRSSAPSSARSAPATSRSSRSSAKPSLPHGCRPAGRSRTAVGA
jgi:hypothetical protein